MSYPALESSTHGGQPVELYRFTSGTRKWLYTSGDVRITHAAEIYEPYLLNRSAFRQTQELNKSGLEIRTPRDLPFVVEMMASPLIGVIALTIYRKHRAHADVIQWWKGRVSGVRFDGSEAVVDCNLLGTSIRRIGLRRPAQRQCAHSLYGVGCNVVEAAHSLSGSLISHIGATVTASAFATQPDGWWIGGKINLAGVLRFVVGHAGDTLTLSSGVPGLAQNAAFVVYPGCDHTAATCQVKFNNAANYGGAPWFPIKNPFSGDSAF